MSLDHLPISPLRRPSSFNFATHIVDDWAKTNPSQNALHWVSQDLKTERKLTYADISTSSHRIATLLHNLGLRPGDVLIVILPRIPAWWELATACLRSGIILCPCTTLLVEKDIEYRLNISNAAAFIGDEISVSKCLKIKQRNACPSLRNIIQINAGSNQTQTQIPSDVDDFSSLLSKIPHDTTFPVPPTLTPTSPALIFFTSGTTGPPKIVLHTQTSYPLAHALTGAFWLRLTPTPSSIYWNLSEQGWAKAAWSFFGAFTNGATLFVHDDRLPFSARRTLEVLHAFPISTLCAPPTVYRQLVLDENRRLFEGELKPRALIHACGAGEPLNQSVIETWRAMSGGMSICDGYGQTETILICANQRGMQIKSGSMGRPLPGVPLTVIDGEGGEAGVGVEGDMAVEIDPPGRSAEDGFFGIFEGYVVDMRSLKLDRRIRETKGGRRFYVTGDRATRDEDGYFWFVGRNDDVINSSGYRIGPFEVESTLKLHDAVVESAVVAAPDPEREEVVKAFVVLTEGKWKEVRDDSGKQQALVKELQDFCKEHAAPYKYPRKMEFVDTSFLPKTISGKIKRAELKKLEKERYQKERKAKL
ncbi:hypothetical protein PMZ80_003613 [Knufia obscura]|uniref:medium-chain acyl-CoA ligase n=2 Tax=Knufia TaxID=430999 RepID=A0AAN8I7S2_9EURO|nr:hypothetical protein PMZ80_003613 [Knufia obscura]KAK5958472.1 hypothetical protein OHC33_000315 [Knufia fluminis]